MKAVILFTCFAFATADIQYYTTANDYLDINAVINEWPKLQQFVDCFLDRAPCSEVPASYKKIIPDSIETACIRCNNAQKHLANRFLWGLKTVLPQEYINFRQKFDPKGKYFDIFEKSVAQY